MIADRIHCWVFLSALLLTACPSSDSVPGTDVIGDDLDAGMSDVDVSDGGMHDGGIQDFRIEALSVAPTIGDASLTREVCWTASDGAVCILELIDWNGNILEGIATDLTSEECVSRSFASSGQVRLRCERGSDTQMDVAAVVTNRGIIRFSAEPHILQDAGPVDIVAETFGDPSCAILRNNILLGSTDTPGFETTLALNETTHFSIQCDLIARATRTVHFGATIASSILYADVPANEVRIKINAPGADMCNAIIRDDLAISTTITIPPGETRVPWTDLGAANNLYADILCKVPAHSDTANLNLEVPKLTETTYDSMTLELCYRADALTDGVCALVSADSSVYTYPLPLEGCVELDEEPTSEMRLFCQGKNGIVDWFFGEP